MQDTQNMARFIFNMILNTTSIQWKAIVSLFLKRLQIKYPKYYAKFCKDIIDITFTHKK